MANTPQKKKIVIVIEDDPIFVHFLTDLFEKRGLDVHVALDGERANELVRTLLPDFVVLDIRLPKRDGIEVLKIIRKEDSTKNLPVLVFTNYDLNEYRADTQNLGILDFLVKADHNPKTVVERVAQFLETGKWN